MGVSPHHGLSHSSLRMYLSDLVIKCENEELWALRDGINKCVELNLPGVEIDVIVTTKFRGSKSHFALEKLTSVLMCLLKEELYFLKILLFFIPPGRCLFVA